MKKTITLLAALLIFAAWSYCQEPGNIYGKVADPEGLALPGVTVTLASAYFPERTVVTGEEGSFRFIRLPVASDYKLTFELVGFNTVIREKIIVRFGRSVTLNIVMEPTTLEEEVTVIATSPIIDTRKTQVGISVSEEMLQDLPTSRNPWVIMDLVPGMLVDRVDVGGNEAGQQSAYYGHGSHEDDGLWFVDGGNITDNSALGAAPAYMNISNYEELQITYGSNDVVSPTGGVAVNIVSYRGGNKYSGSFYLDAERAAWQRENVPSDMEALGYTSAGVNRLYLYGANFGGPLVRDKAWFYLAWGVQDIDAKTLAGLSDKTWLVSGYAKFNLQLNPNIRAEGFYEYDDKNKWGRAWIGYAYQSAESLWNQTGPGAMYKGEFELMFGNLLMTTRVSLMDGGFLLTPVGWGSGDYFHRQYYPTTYWTGNCDLYGTDRDQWNINFVGTYFAENIMGADHEIKFGADYVWAKTTTYDLYEGNAVIADRGSSYADFYGATVDPWIEAWIMRDYYINYAFTRYSAYIQDMMTFGNLAVTLGVRYDQEKSVVKDQATGASPHMSSFMPALTIDEWDPGATWKTISPRIGISWDIFGTGKDVLKISAARYGSQSGNNLADHVNPGGWTEIDMLWIDDGDGKIQDGELFGYDWDTGQLIDRNNPDYWLWYTGFDPADPGGELKAVNRIDPDFNSPLLDELMISYQKELVTDFAARLELFYKKRHKIDWDFNYFADGHVETAADQVVDSQVTREGETKDIYGYTEWPYGEHRANSGRSTRYLAGQLVLTKRLSNRWMLDASFTYSDWKFYFGDKDQAGEDLSNYDFYDGGVEAPESGGSGMTDVFVNSRWQAKFMGLYQLPLGINISATFIAREGYVIPRYIDVNAPKIDASYDLFFGKQGDTRLPTFWIANLRLEKVFEVGENSRVVLSADGFNITNNSTSLKKEAKIDNADFLDTKRIINPTVFRFGVRYEF